jgi:intron-binding protein aquarius
MYDQPFNLQYLWPNFDSVESTNDHVLSIAQLLNEKFRQRISSPLSIIISSFPEFFRRVLSLILTPIELIIRESLIVFLINVFGSLENEVVRTSAMKLVSIGSWHSLVDDVTREREILGGGLVKSWAREEKRFNKAGI